MDEFDAIFTLIDDSSLEQLDNQLSQFNNAILQPDKVVADHNVPMPGVQFTVLPGANEKQINDYVERLNKEKEQFQLDALAKAGEVSIIRSQFNKLESENNLLRQELKTKVTDATLLEDRLKSKYERELDRLKTQMLFDVSFIIETIISF
jgi:hypothetical protein